MSISVVRMNSLTNMEGMMKRGSEIIAIIVPGTNDIIRMTRIEYLKRNSKIASKQTDEEIEDFFYAFRI